MIGDRREVLSRRRGYTLVEMGVVSGLMAFLGLLLASVVAVFGKPSLDVLSRARVLRESRLAVASLRADLGGSLPLAQASRSGTPETGVVVDAMAAGGGQQLWLDFDGAVDGNTAPNGQADWGSPDTVIVYSLQGRGLVRADQTAGSSVVIAGDIAAFTVATESPDLVKISIQFAFRDATRTETLLWHRPIQP